MRSQVSTKNNFLIKEEKPLENDIELIQLLNGEIVNGQRKNKEKKENRGNMC